MKELNQDLSWRAELKVKMDRIRSTRARSDICRPSRPRNGIVKRNYCLRHSICRWTLRTWVASRRQAANKHPQTYLLSPKLKATVTLLSGKVSPPLRPSLQGAILSVTPSNTSSFLLRTFCCPPNSRRISRLVLVNRSLLALWFQETRLELPRSTTNTSPRLCPCLRKSLQSTLRLHPRCIKPQPHITLMWWIRARANLATHFSQAA